MRQNIEAGFLMCVMSNIICEMFEIWRKAMIERLATSQNNAGQT